MDPRLIYCGPFFIAAIFISIVALLTFRRRDDPGGREGSVKRIAVYPGTFDPVTNGHLDIVERGLRIFERSVDLTTGGETCNTIRNQC